MSLLKRYLYLFAFVGCVVGVLLVVAPGFLLVTVFRQGELGDWVWVRVAGVQALGAAMLAVLVGHRAAELWWWTWAFILPLGGLLVLFVVRALTGGSSGSVAVWWMFAAASAVLATGLVVGLRAAAREAPML